PLSSVRHSVDGTDHRGFAGNRSKNVIWMATQRRRPRKNTARLLAFSRWRAVSRALEWCHPARDGHRRRGRPIDSALAHPLETEAIMSQAIATVEHTNGLVREQSRPWDEHLTPLGFLDRSATAFRDKTAVVYGDQRWTYGEFAERVNRLASALRAAGL